MDKIEFSQIGIGKLKIDITGRFDFSQCQTILFKGVEYREQGVTDVILDMRHCNYMDSSALGVLLKMREDCTRNISIINANNTIKEIFRIANFHKLFKVEGLS